MPNADHSIESEEDGWQYVETYLDEGFKGYDKYVEQMIEAL